MTHFRLDHDESLSTGAFRVITELTEEALQHLELRDDPVEAIHGARKASKKARGLARLVRPSLERYSEVNESFRDAARQLGPIRDPQAFANTFHTLAETPAASDHVRSLRGQFEARAREATERIEGEEAGRLDGARELIRVGGLDAEDWEMDDDFDSIASGVKKTYRRGRKAMARAQETGEPGDFHEWRKRAKYLWYQMRLLRNMSRSILRPLSRRLHDVSDALGDAHDLFLMQGQVESFDADDAAKHAFSVVASGYVLELETRALSLGSRLWAEEPSTFVDRLGLYWDVWRERGEELEAGEIEEMTSTSDVPRMLVTTA